MNAELSFVDRVRSPDIEAAALKEGFSALQARVLAGRLDATTRSVAGVVRPRVSELDSPGLLPDIGLASGHLADAVEQGRPIAIVTDHDADGATSHAIIRLCLLAWGASAGRVGGFLSHRMREGYGVSDALVDRMLPSLSPSTCVVTADQGSTDEPRIARLRAAGHVVVVTDHHGVPEAGHPPSAHAVVNPVRRDSLFPDPAIAGCHTALLVMAATRDELIRRGHLPQSATRASDFMDLSAVGTVADAASLGRSFNNRAIVQRGLQIINERPRPCWRALRRVLGKDGPWSASDIAFQLATRINARGRVDDAMRSVEFLVAEDEEDAYRMALDLDAANRERRTIERSNTRIAMNLAQREVATGRYGLCLWLGEEGHSGVHGICASRVVERFGRPTICVSPVAGQADVVTGSVRSTDRVHVRDVLAAIHVRHPNLLLGFGGHAGAGGLRLRKENVARMAEAWDECVRRCYSDGCPVPTIRIDGDLDRPSLAHVEQIAALEPFGRGFEQPVFYGEWRVATVRPIGDGSHLKLSLSRKGEDYEAVWFGAKEVDDPVPVFPGQWIRAAYVVESNLFRGTTRLQLQIRHVLLDR